MAAAEGDREALRARLLTRLPARWRTRFAPAPTGFLHLGHAVNAVHVWSIAQAFGGRVIVRIEDHDHTRARAEYRAAILDDLAWLGLASDNRSLGLTEPETQQDEAPYADALARLDAAGRIYACRCSRRDIAAVTSAGDELRYPGTCRTALVSPDDTRARRCTLPDVSVTFDDLRHGQQSQRPQAQCGDVLVRDRLGQWTYQFAVVVDDMRHGIDVIIRGDDLLASTGRQLLLAEALGRHTAPIWLHHPLVTHADGTKLSKSNGDTALSELRAAGWTAPQVLGHAAWRGGLQATDAPLDADALGTLWNPLA